MFHQIIAVGLIIIQTFLGEITAEGMYLTLTVDRCSAAAVSGTAAAQAVAL